MNSGTGTTNASPAIDPNRLYVYSYGLDGYVHKYRVGDGTEILTGGWPELGTLKSNVEKVAAALAFATAANGTTYLYLVHDGYIGDGGDYQGHITTINLSNGTQKVFNTLCSDQPVHFVSSPGTPDCASRRSGIWARNGVTYDDVTDRVYFATGNGQFNASTGGHNWGDSVLSIPADGSDVGGGPADSYTPVNFQQLENGDTDLGSTGPAILPASSFAGRLAVQSGKDGQLRLIDLSNMSGQGGPGHVGGELELQPLPQGGVVKTTPAVWINPADASTWVFIVDSSGSSAMKLTFPGGAPSLVKQWQNSLGGSSPLVANNVIYFANATTIRALDPQTGNLLWSDATKIAGNHWQSPMVFNATLYVTDEGNHLTAYALRPPVTPTQTPPPTSTPTARPSSTPKHRLRPTTAHEGQHTNPNADEETNSDANADPDKEADGDGYTDEATNSHAGPYTYTDPKTHEDADSNADEETYSDANADPDKEADGNAYVDEATNSHANPNTDPKAHAHADSNANKEIHCDSHANPDKEADGDAFADEATNSHADSELGWGRIAGSVARPGPAQARRRLQHAPGRAAPDTSNATA